MVHAHLVEDHWAGILGRTTNKGQLRDLAEEESGLLQFRILNLGFLQDGDVGVGVGVFPEGEESADGLRYCGSPTFRTSSANRGSERMGSSNKLVFKSPSSQSCS